VEFSVPSSPKPLFQAKGIPDLYVRIVIIKL
jgi:hypothetical protein